MRRFFFIVLVLCVIPMVLPSQARAVRYAQCDACGLCKDTTKTIADTGGKTVYVQPSTWKTCYQCLYPTLNPTLAPVNPAPTLTPIPCPRDENGKDLKFVNIQLSPTDVRCETIIINPTPNINAPQNTPQSGRVFSDLGCISVNTTGGTFTDPNASVDVIQILLRFITSITGGVGAILIMVAAVRLIISRGDPERIREARKTLSNVVLGVLFSLFALFIFQFFAVQVLKIPGFN